MTKKEFIEKMNDMPDDAEVYFWDFNHDDWIEAKPYLMKGNMPFNYHNGKIIANDFIGIE